MDMDQSAVFLAGSILTGLGFICVAISILVINNLCSKYWKPVKWIRYEEPNHSSLPPRFATPEEVAALDKSKEPNLK